MKTHKDLDVWKSGIDLVEKIYQLTKSFPPEEQFIMTSQVRRAVIAISSNIAEGFARKNVKETIQFLYISLGSLSEHETQMIICQRLQFINDDKLLLTIEEIRRKLLNLIKYLKTKV